MVKSKTDGPFDMLESVFRLGCRAPEPWSLDGRKVAGLPDRDIALNELRGILLHPSTGHPTRNAALSILVARARAEGGSATVGLAGVLMFGLRRAVAPLRAACPARGADLESEALVGLIEGIASTDPGHPVLAARLCWLARNRAKRLFEAELGEQGSQRANPGGDAPPAPCAHPDLVLAHAVSVGVICRDDAALIGDTRFGLMSVDEAAYALGISRAAALKRRRRAEQHLAAFLASDDYRRELFVRPSNPRTYLRGRGRPRGAANTDRQAATTAKPGGENREVATRAGRLPARRRPTSSAGRGRTKGVSFGRSPARPVRVASPVPPEPTGPTCANRPVVASQTDPMPPRT